MPERNHGRFIKGRSGNPSGRPPRKYSITSALANMADEPYTAAEDGTMLTRAECAAQWVWEKVLTGLDDQGVPLSTRDRMECIKLALDRTEPTAGLLKLWERDGDSEQAEDAELIARLEHLSDEERAVLEKISQGESFRRTFEIVRLASLPDGRKRPGGRLIKESVNGRSRQVTGRVNTSRLR